MTPKGENEIVLLFPLLDLLDSCLIELLIRVVIGGERKELTLEVVVAVNLVPSLLG